MAECTCGRHPVQHGVGRRPLRPEHMDPGRSNRQALALAAISAGFLMITLDATIAGGDRRRPRRDAVDRAIGRRRLHRHVRFAAPSRRLVGRRDWRSHGLSRRADGLRAGQRSMRRRRLRHFPDRGRVAQGVGAAWLMPSSLALITHTFAEPQARGRALAVWGAMSGIGLASGPLVGGFLVASVGWRAIFLVNVPVGLVAAWVLTRHADETTRRHQPLDLPGQLLAMFSLAALTAGFINAGAHGWTAGVTLALGSPESWASRHSSRREHGTPAADRPGRVPRQGVHDRGRDRLPFQLLPVREHFLPRDRSWRLRGLTRSTPALRCSP